MQTPFVPSAPADTTASATIAAVPAAPLTVESFLEPATWLALGVTIGQVVLILVLAGVLDRLIARLTRRWERIARGNEHRRNQRATLANLTRSAARYVIWPVALIMALSEVGLDVGPLLATAGIAGLAIGFGAQTLVRDVISGIFLLFDDTIHVGDTITFNGQTGVVEDVGLRLIQFRTFQGDLVMVPAGDLRIFSNRSIDFVRAIVDMNISYEHDTDEVLRLLEEVAKAWAAEAENRAKLLDEAPQVQAFLALNENAVTTRLVVKTRPGEQYAIERDLRRRIKQALDAHGLDIAVPSQTVVMRQVPDLPARTVEVPTETQPPTEA